MSFDKLGNFCLQNNIPIITQATRDFLKNFLLYIKPRVICEVGTAIGFSSLYFNSILPESLIYTFEISYPAYLQALFNTTKQTANIICYNFDFLKVNLDKFFSRVDFFFVDGKKADYFVFIKKIFNFLQDKTHPVTIIIDDVIEFSNKIDFDKLVNIVNKYNWKYKVFKLSDGDGVMILSKDKKVIDKRLS